MKNTFTFTFMHLADAFIQSDLHCIQVTVFTFDQLLLSLGIEPMILALLAPCSTIWATGKPYILPYKSLIKNTDKLYILCNRMFIVFKFHQLKFLLSLLCVLFSDNWLPSWSVFSSITSAMDLWNFCARAPSGVQYELNSHCITCVLSNAHNTLFGVKTEKIILFSKETGFPELSSLISLSQ